MNVSLLILILLAIIALLGISVLNENRKQHSAQSPKASGFQRRIDSNVPATYYNQQHKNPWIVEPQNAASSRSQPGSSREPGNP